MTYLLNEGPGGVYIDPEAQIAAWRAWRTDDLYSDPKALAEAVDEYTYLQSGGALQDILAALTSIEPGATPLDNTILRHEAAWKVIDQLVKEVVDAEEKDGDWRNWDV